MHGELGLYRRDYGLWKCDRGKTAVYLGVSKICEEIPSRKYSKLNCLKLLY